MDVHEHSPVVRVHQSRDAEGDSTLEGVTMPHIFECMECEDACVVICYSTPIPPTKCVHDKEKVKPIWYKMNLQPCGLCWNCCVNVHSHLSTLEELVHDEVTN